MEHSVALPHSALESDTNSDASPTESTGQPLEVLRFEAKVPEKGRPAKQAVLDYLRRHGKIRGSEVTQTRACYRHRRGSQHTEPAEIQDLQSELRSLNHEDSAVISVFWDSFKAAPLAQRRLILNGMLKHCCLPQLSEVSSTISDLIRIDFLAALPLELSFKILGYLDAKSLVRAAQVSHRWKELADDDVVWYHMCEQHIDRKCTKCGWGLPLLDRRRLRQSKKAVMKRLENLTAEASVARQRAVGNSPPVPALAVPHTELATVPGVSASEPALECGSKRGLPDDCLPSDSDAASVVKKQAVRQARPWKDVYVERYKVEHNWRTGRYSIKEFEHSSPVLSLQFDEQFLITGTHDGNITIWDVETRQKINELKGHFRAVSALKFDSNKLVTGSWDQSVRVWNYRTGQCICTFGGHDSKVLCIDFDGDLIAAGSEDASIKVWDFHEKSCFTLRGHREPVHSVRIHAASATLYTSSEDLTVRMWDLRTKTCIKVFGGPENGPAAHIAQIQQALPITLEHLEGEEDHHHNPIGTSESEGLTTTDEDELSIRRPTHLLTASLDNTIKVWDIRTGRCARTLFGHVEGVWCMVADHFRIISGAHDKLVKVWDVQSGKCWHTFSGHTKPVTCVGLHDTGFASGGDDGMVKLHNFDI